MFLKIMYGENKPDGDRDKTHKFVEVTEYEFFVNGNGEYTLGYFIRGNVEEHTEPMRANVYVLNDSGKTINSFHLPTDMRVSEQAPDLEAEDWLVRLQAVELGNLTPEQHQKALDDVSIYVRAAAVKLGNLTPEQHQRALNDSDDTVRAEAVKLGNLTLEQQQKALNDKNPNIRTIAIKLGNMDIDQLITVMNDRNILVRLAATEQYNIINARRVNSNI